VPVYKTIQKEFNTDTKADEKGENGSLHKQLLDIVLQALVDEGKAVGQARVRKAQKGKNKSKGTRSQKRHRIRILFDLARRVHIHPRLFLNIGPEVKDILHQRAKEALGSDFISQIEHTAIESGVIGSAMDSVRHILMDKNVNKIVVCAQADLSINLFRDALHEVTHSYYLYSHTRTLAHTITYTHTHNHTHTFTTLMHRARCWTRRQSFVVPVP
jgi:hypothetical protein